MLKKACLKVQNLQLKFWIENDPLPPLFRKFIPFRGATHPWLIKEESALLTWCSPERKTNSQTLRRGWRWPHRPLYWLVNLPTSRARRKTSAGRLSGSGEEDNADFFCWNFLKSLTLTRTTTIKQKTTPVFRFGQKTTPYELRYLGQRQVYDHREDVDEKESETLTSTLRFFTLPLFLVLLHLCLGTHRFLKMTVSI